MLQKLAKLLQEPSQKLVKVRIHQFSKGGGRAGVVGWWVSGLGLEVGGALAGSQLNNESDQLKCSFPLEPAG